MSIKRCQCGRQIYNLTIDDDHEVPYELVFCPFQVTPAAGVIKPDSYIEVSVHHEEFHTLEEFVDGIPQNWWCEDTRDKEVMLSLVVQGCCSNDTRKHQIRVRHCFSAKTVRIDSKSNGSRKHQGGSTNRSEPRQPSGSSDGSDDRRS